MLVLLGKQFLGHIKSGFTPFIKLLFKFLRNSNSMSCCVFIVFIIFNFFNFFFWGSGIMMLNEMLSVGLREDFYVQEAWQVTLHLLVHR